MVRFLLAILVLLGSPLALAQSYQVSLSVEPPGAELFVQGGHAGTVGGTTTVTLPGPGVYSLRVEKAGYTSREQLVYLDQGRRTAQLSFTLVPNWQAPLEQLAAQAPMLLSLLAVILAVTLLIGLFSQRAFGLVFAASVMGAVLGLTSSGAWAAAALAVFGIAVLHAYATGERPVRRPMLGALISCALLVAAAWVIHPPAASGTALTATLPLGPFPSAASALPTVAPTTSVERSPSAPTARTQAPPAEPAAPASTTSAPAPTSPQLGTAPAAEPASPAVDRSTPAERTQAPPAESASATQAQQSPSDSRRRSSETESAGQLTRSTNPLAERLRNQEAPQAASRSSSATQRSPSSTPEPPPASSLLARGDRVNLNTASRSELEQIPGITPVAIQAILTNRPFSDEIQAQRTRGLSTIWRDIEPYVEIR